MDACRRPRLKVCCIRDRDEARLAIDYGAALLGFVSAMPSGPGVIAEPLIAELAAHTPPGVVACLLTSLRQPDAIVAQQRRLGPAALQLVDHVAPEDHRALRAALPGIGLLQVVHVGGPAALDEARELAGSVDALLLDSGNPALAVKELGGTGRVHDWAVSRRIREAVNVPLYLAGGLRPDNVRAAIEAVGPFGLDVCSGVRRAGRLDEGLLAAFVREIERSA